MYAGLGSNVGDRADMLQRAVDALRLDFDVFALSSVYETDPVGPPQPDFLNAVIGLRTSRSAVDVLRRFKTIESELGREQRERWGPREIDIDLLIYGDEQIHTEDLRVPHPSLIERAFVLVPLAEIAPDLDIPGAGRASTLRERVDASGVRLFGSLR